MDEFRNWAVIHNFSRIISFHNDLRSCMRDALAKTDELDPIETKLWEARWQDYDTLLHVNTFLMIYAHTEEWLYLLSKKYHPSIDINNRGSISRYKLVLRDGFKIDISNSQWHLLTDCENIRDCLLHTNGRMDLMKNKDEIKEIAKRRNIDIELNKLRIPSDFLALFAKEIEDFLNKLV